MTSGPWWYAMQEDLASVSPDKFFRIPATLVLHHPTPFADMGAARGWNWHALY